MAKDLGQTSDPEELVPGNPAAVVSTCAALRSYGDALHTAGEGLKRIDTTDGWSGEAGDAFRAAFDGEPAKWLEAGDCFHDAANALQNYESALTWAQGQAAEAIKQWNAGEDATDAARTEHEQEQREAGHDLPFADPGEASRNAARHTLDSARDRLDGAGDAAADAVGTARDKAPKKPGFWDGVGHFLSGTGNFLADVGETAVGDLASVGNAMLHDPGSVAETAGGLALAALGAGGEVGGIVLDATGVGAVIGVPANIVSAGAIAGGLGLAGAGMSNILHDAAGSDRVDMSSDSGGGGGSSAADSPTTGAGRTKPSGTPDPNAAPEGHTTSISRKADPETVRALTRENESAEILSRKGYRVEQNPKVPETAKNPDYRVEGEVFDCYAPTTDKTRGIADAIEKKVKKGQADRIILNLSDSSVDPVALNAQLHDWPIEGLKEVTVIDKMGNVLHFYP